MKQKPFKKKIKALYILKPKNLFSGEPLTPQEQREMEEDFIASAKEMGVELTELSEDEHDDNQVDDNDDGKLL